MEKKAKGEEDTFIKAEKENDEDEGPLEGI